MSTTEIFERATESEPLRYDSNGEPYTGFIAAKTAEQIHAMPADKQPEHRAFKGAFGS